MAALDHPCNDIVAPETDGPLELQEDLCRCEHRRPLPAHHDEDSRPQPPSDTVQRILEGVPLEGGEISRPRAATCSLGSQRLVQVVGVCPGTALSTAFALPANWTRMAPPLTPPGRRLRRATSAPTTLATSSRTSAGSSSGWVPSFMLSYRIRPVSVCELLVLSSVEASRVCRQSVEPISDELR
jgi:hypothetical protein